MSLLRQKAGLPWRSEMPGSLLGPGSRWGFERGASHFTGGRCARPFSFLLELGESMPLLKVGTWHKVSAKHLQAYCEEMTFRSNRRKNSDLSLDTLRRMVTAPILTLRALIAPDRQQTAPREFVLLELDSASIGVRRSFLLPCAAKTLHHHDVGVRFDIFLPT